MLETTYGEDMILMQAISNFTVPDGPSTKLVEVAAFRHEHISDTKRHPVCYLHRHFDHCDVREIEMPVLDVRNTQIRPLNQPPLVHLAKGEPALNLRDAFEVYTCWLPPLGKAMVGVRVANMTDARFISPRNDNFPH